MDKLRLRFEKTGRAVYISHLDLMHTMQRAFSRADFELKYSEGFNPHPQISIALPLSVGMSSYCELMDFRLKGEPDLGDLPSRLTAVMPEGIRITECYTAEQKFAALKYLEITGRFEYDRGKTADIYRELRDFFAADSIVISRKTKRGIGESDIRPAIKEISFSEKDGSIALHTILSAQETTLNPLLLPEALHQLAPELEPDFAAFTRLETYYENMQVFR